MWRRLILDSVNLHHHWQTYIIMQYTRNRVIFIALQYRERCLLAFYSISYSKELETFTKIAKVCKVLGVGFIVGVAGNTILKCCDSINIVIA